MSQLKDMQTEAAAHTSRRGPANRLLMHMLSEMEKMVVNVEEPLFIRMLAWFVLVMWWAVLRYDDTCWLSPSTVRIDEGYWAAWISRSKTTGRSKRIEGLAAVVSEAAWLEESGWLRVGHELWEQHAGFKRDFFLVLGESDLSAARNVPATYSDALAMVRSLWSRFLPEESMGFWTLHSMRRGLPAAAAACGAPPDWVELLGAWAPSNAQRYSEQRVQRILQMQTVVAAKLKDAKGLRDFIDESANLAALGKHMEKQGLDKDEAHMNIEVLRYFGLASQLPDHNDEVLPWGGDIFGSTSASSGLGFEQTVLEAVTDMGPSEDIETECVAEPLEKKAKTDDGLPEEARGFVISISRRHGRRCLHYVGRCPRVPYVHYREAEEMGRSLPPAHTYNIVCGDCWPDKKVVGSEAQENEEDQNVSAAESSSDEDDELETPL